jgi:glucose/arabinose dehydrogenase
MPCCHHTVPAAIWVLNTDGSGKRLFATGLRNPVGLANDPATGDLWTTVNERDGLGEEHPPDYLTRVVDGAFVVRRGGVSRSRFIGVDVVFVPFADGSLLVTDNDADVIWRVVYRP